VAASAAGGQRIKRHGRRAVMSRTTGSRLARRASGAPGNALTFIGPRPPEDRSPPFPPPRCTPFSAPKGAPFLQDSRSLSSKESRAEAGPARRAARAIGLVMKWRRETGARRRAEAAASSSKEQSHGSGFGWGLHPQRGRGEAFGCRLMAVRGLFAYVPSGIIIATSTVGSGKKRGRSWNQPLAVGLVTGAVAAAATVTAAIISSSGADKTSSVSSAAFRPPGLTVDAVTFGKGTNGQEVVTVDGSAHGLQSGDLVYAIAKPQDELAARPATPSAQATSPAQTAASGSRWFASAGTQPDKNGRWATEIIVSSQATLTVQAVEMPPTVSAASTTETSGPPSASPPGSAGTTSSASPTTTDTTTQPEDENQLALENAGPNASGLAVSRPFTAGPR